MHLEKRVLRGDTPEGRALLADGWSVIARSWGAGLRAADVDGERLRSAASSGIAGLSLRELTADDVEAVLALDAATANDYPGDVATSHTPLTRGSATLGAARRAWGAFVDGELVAMTVVDVDGAHAETDFTVVAAVWRRRGLGTAVKAASIATLVRDGVTTFRTGGSAENAGSLAANRSLGYVVDEQWWTLAPPGPETHASVGPRVLTTDRLALRAVRPDDVDELHVLHADPRVWTHLPSGRHETRAQTVEAVAEHDAAWDRDGLSFWTARRLDDDEFVGIGGVRRAAGGRVWNTYYRIAPEQQGQGFATEIARAGHAAAASVGPEIPVIASLLEHNVASKATAERLGLTLAWRGPAGQGTHAEAVRLIYADRPLDTPTREALLPH